MYLEWIYLDLVETIVVVYQGTQFWRGYSPSKLEAAIFLYFYFPVSTANGGKMKT